MKNSEILIAARAKLDTPEKWTQGACWRNVFGEHDVPLTEANCFCTFGAIEALAQSGVETYAAWEHLRDVVGDVGPIAYNDKPGRKHSEILEMFDKAIALAQQEENENV